MAKFDVLVIGAGILGVSSAYHIKKNSPEKRVLLIDRYGDAGQANTGRSNAMFRNTFSSVDNQDLVNASIDYYIHVQKDLDIDIGVDLVSCSCRLLRYGGCPGVFRLHHLRRCASPHER